MPALATVELDRDEALTLLGLVRTRLAEVERMAHGIAEGEGMDLQRHNAAKQLDRQTDLLQTLTMKLEEAAREAAGSGHRRETS
ncbi:MAG TPA: hypothetical protein VNX21_08870 [Candidatus Thermoplasmatota archaeon]|nr:hypothetical protein [Candidatus Thermoplasmatota archaeon]